MKLFSFLGLVALVVGLAVGCDSPGKPTPPAGSGAAPSKKDAQDDHDHDHDAPGPHKGLVFDFGKGHAEFCVDHGKKQVTVYTLNYKNKDTAVAAPKLHLSIKKPAFEVDLLPSPQDGDPQGKASRFVVTHDNFGKEQEFEGTLTGEIDGKPYSADFKEEEHDHGKKK